MTTLSEARRAKALIVERLAAVDEVAGIGLTRDADGYVVKVNLRGQTRKVPRKMQGVRVRVEYIGGVRALGS
jgi:hypothetical protein